VSPGFRGCAGVSAAVEATVPKAARGLSVATQEEGGSKRKRNGPPVEARRDMVSRANDKGLEEGRLKLEEELTLVTSFEMEVDMFAKVTSYITRKILKEALYIYERR